MTDNWKHRSAGMRCATCMWFVPKTPSVQAGDGDGPRCDEMDRGRELGRCRRHSPTLQGWPALFEDDWCGDHKLDEERI